MLNPRRPESKAEKTLMTDLQLVGIREPVLALYPGQTASTAMQEINKNKDGWRTLGDLHGNALKFLYFLTLVGAVEISPGDYTTFATVYFGGLTMSYEGAQDVPNARAINALKTVMNNIKVADGRKIRLLGDELADRGKNDLLTLMLIDKLIKGGVELEIILSNHSCEFIRYMEGAILYATVSDDDLISYNEDEEKCDKESESKSEMDAQGTFVDPEHFKAYVEDYEYSSAELLLPVSQRTSLEGLFKCLNAGAVDPAELIAYYHTYTSVIKAFSYDYSASGDLIVYSHAPVGYYEHILKGAAELKEHLPDVEYKRVEGLMKSYTLKEDIHSNTSALKCVIDAINDVVQDGLAHFLLSASYFPKEGQTKMAGSALLSSIWNRGNPGDDLLLNVHGHCMFTFGANRMSLDSMSGRKVAEEFKASDVLYFTHSHGIKLDPAQNASSDVQPPLKRRKLN